MALIGCECVVALNSVFDSADGRGADAEMLSEGPYLGTVSESVGARAQGVLVAPTGCPIPALGIVQGEDLGRLAGSTAATKEFSDTPTQVPSNALP